MDKTALEEIAAIEGEMLDRARTCGGQSFRREEPAAYFIRRTSRLEMWTQQMRESYLRLLRQAETEGRNLLCEGHACLLEWTDPVKYAKIKERLPERSMETLWLADWLWEAHRAWRAETERAYPCLSALTSGGETDLRGELTTYSVELLRLYAAYVEHLETEGRNMNQMILENTAAQYGFDSLEAAELRLSWNAV